MCISAYIYIIFICAYCKSICWRYIITPARCEGSTGATVAADFPSAWPKVAALSGARAGWWWFFPPSGAHQKPGWWLNSLSHPSEKWWSSSVGMMKFPIYGGHKSHVPNHQPETNEPTIIWINSRKPSSVGPYAMHRIWSFWSGKGPPKKPNHQVLQLQKSLSFNCLALGRTDANQCPSIFPMGRDMCYIRLHHIHKWCIM